MTPGSNSGGSVPPRMRASTSAQWYLRLRSAWSSRGCVARKNRDGSIRHRKMVSRDRAPQKKKARFVAKRAFSYRDLIENYSFDQGSVVDTHATTRRLF